MVEREDAIHIRIKIDVDAEDKELIQKLSSDLATADAQGIGKTSEKTIVSKEEQTDEEINDLEDEIKQIKKRIEKGADPKDPQIIKDKLEAKRDKLLLKEFKEGPVGIVADFTSENVPVPIRLIAATLK